VKILFFARHYTYLRNFESVLTGLLENGHHIHVAVDIAESFGGTSIVERLTAEFPGRVTSGLAPRPRGREYTVGTRLRFGIDYLRYLSPPYEKMPRLGLRARSRAPIGVLRLTERWPFRTAAGRRFLTRWLTAVERRLPVHREMLDFLDAQKPDVVLFTPLIGVVASPQPDYLLAAMARRLPTALCVWSWDHLSSKALIRTIPDRILVWNPIQQREATELHGVRPGRVVVTGAQCFDQWFDRQPSRARAEFCRRVGLRDDRPFLLWVCSSLFKGSPPEAAFVMRWIRELRTSGHPELRDANILVRPHPARLPEWRDVDVTTEPGVALWGSNPVDVESRSDYFDSLHYSAGVVGINTSAFIEGAIAGRPAFTILLPEYFENQEGTIHFHYLFDGDAGLLTGARTFADHATQLAAALRGEVDGRRSATFVSTFVRPHGVRYAATPFVVGAIQQVPSVATRRKPPRARLLTRVTARVFLALIRTEAGWMLTYDEAGAARERRKQAESAAKLTPTT
jgi:hypothetical protein